MWVDNSTGYAFYGFTTESGIHTTVSGLLTAVQAGALAEELEWSQRPSAISSIRCRGGEPGPGVTDGQWGGIISGLGGFELCDVVPDSCG